MKNRGITLIALIITIIVLIILAGITIGMLTNNGGVANQAERARTETSIGKEKELLQVGIYGAMTSHKENIVTEENLRNEMKAYATVDRIRNKLIVTFNDSKRQYEVDTVGEILEYKKVKVSDLPVMNNTKFRNGLSDEEKESVLSVTVLDKLNPPTEYYKLFDVSVSQNGSIKVWLIENSENAGKYDLYIGGKDGVRINSCSNTFNGFTNCEKFDLYNLYTDGIDDMRQTFLNCSKVKYLDLEHFDTSDVTYMYGTFAGCSSLEKVDISSWDTGKVTALGNGGSGENGGLFHRCNKLKEFDISNWNVEKVQSMEDIFNGCSSLESANLSHWNTRSLTVLRGAFNDCNILKNINIGNDFDTSKVTTMQKMFRNCKELERLNVGSKFDTKKVKSFDSTFYGCSKLEEIGVHTLNISSATVFSNIFCYCKKLQGDFTFVADEGYEPTISIGNSFSSCYLIENITFIGNISLTAMGGSFRHCEALKTIDLSGFNTTGVTGTGRMFEGCKKLTTIYVGDNWDMTNVTSSDYMFTGCTKLVGDIPFNSSYVDKTYATATGGYLTYKSNS